MGLPFDAMLSSLRTFAGLEHRLQWVREPDGVSYYNDSKATNVGAALAIEGLGSDMDGKLILIAGGDGKGADFSGLRDSVAKHCRAVVLMGRDSGLIADALGDAVPQPGPLRWTTPSRKAAHRLAQVTWYCCRPRAPALTCSKLRRTRPPLCSRSGGIGMIFGFAKPYPSPLITGRGIDLDFPLLAGCLALLGLGLVMITSASSEVAALQSGNTLYHMIRHLFYIVLGLGACVMTMMVPIATCYVWASCC